MFVRGYFQDTLNEELKAKMRASHQRIGFAFLDCSTAASYKIVLEFLLDVICPTQKMFIYLDEYFIEPSIPPLYSAFTKVLKERYEIQSLYMRNAGNFGALFCLTPPVEDQLQLKLPA